MEGSPHHNAQTTVPMVVTELNDKVAIIAERDKIASILQDCVDFLNSFTCYLEEDLRGKSEKLMDRAAALGIRPNKGG